MTSPTRYTGLIDKYRNRLPVAPETRAVSLNEGNTPLIQLVNIPRLIGKTPLFGHFADYTPSRRREQEQSASAVLFAYCMCGIGSA